MSYSATAPTAGLISTNNVIGSIGSTLAGLAAMAPTIATSLQSAHLPVGPGGWASLLFGVLALFSRG